MASSRGGVQRVLAKLKNSVEDGNYYEAHQMYKTIYFRYKNQGKFLECVDLLYNGAITLITYNQHQSGADLAMLLLTVLEDHKIPFSNDILDKVGHVHKLMDCDSDERQEFVSTALRWSNIGSHELKSGHPDLHRKFALTTWNEKKFMQAQYHFVHSKDGEGCATMLVEYHVTYGFPSEVDMFIVQVVLQYLCLKNKITAASAFKSYTNMHPQVDKGPPYVHPLINFIWMLLLAIEGGRVAVFTILCEHYQPSLKRDPLYLEYLDKIGQHFFGVPPKIPKSQGGLFGGILQSLFTMGDDMDDMEDVNAVACSSTSQQPCDASYDLD